MHKNYNYRYLILQKRAQYHNNAKKKSVTDTWNMSKVRYKISFDLEKYQYNENVTYKDDYHVNVILLMLHFLAGECYKECIVLCMPQDLLQNVFVVSPVRKQRQSSSFFCDTGCPRSIWWLWFHQSGWAVGMCGYHCDPCWFRVGEDYTIHWVW